MHNRWNEISYLGHGFVEAVVKSRLGLNLASRLQFKQIYHIVVVYRVYRDRCFEEKKTTTLPNPIFSPR